MIGRGMLCQGGPCYDREAQAGPKNSVGVKDEYGVPDMSLKGFGQVWSACGGRKGV